MKLQLQQRGAGRAFAPSDQLWTLALTLGACASILGELPAQQSQPFQVGKIWVDPLGNDANSGQVNAPVRSITRALDLCDPLPAGFTDMVIMVRPGNYNSNVETFPLRMTKNTSLQGTSALNTNIAGDMDLGQVLILFQADEQNEFNRSFIDGFNIREGGINIRIENDATHVFACRPLISNCFINDASQWAIDIVSAPNGASTDDLDPACTPGILLPQTGWIVHRPKIINCTFRNNRHCIMNRTNTLPGEDDPPLVGISEPGLMNLICADSHVMGEGPKDDLLGIDKKDLEIIEGSVVVFPTSCAFDRANPFGLYDTTICASGLPPLALFRPADVVSLVAPLFVEDVVGNPGPAARGADMRLNPALVGRSPSPVDVGYLPPGNIVTWANGTVANLKLSRNGLDYADLRDVDCEGFCNPRIVGLIDLGADELGQLVTAGYSPFTTRFFNGFTVFRWIGPGYVGGATQYYNANQISPPPTPYVDSDLFPFVIRPLHTVAPYDVPGLTGTACLQGATTVSWNLVGNEPYAIAAPVSPPFLINEQFVLHDTSVITNLQAFRLN